MPGLETAIQQMIPAADPIGIPAPPALLQFLLVLTFVIHVVFLGLLVGGTLIALVNGLALRRAGLPIPAATASAAQAGATAGATGEDSGAGATAPSGAGASIAWRAALHRHLMRMLPAAMAFTVTSGVAPLLFVQLLYGRFFYTSSVLMAWPWLSVIPLLIIGYYLLYYAAWKDRLWALAVAGLIFAGIGFVYTNDMSLYSHPEQWPSVWAGDPSGLALPAGEPSILPRYLHAVLLALSIGATWVVFFGHLLSGREAAQPGARMAGSAIRRHGLTWLAAALALQVPVAPWYLLAMPSELGEWVRSSPWGTGLMGAAIVLGAVGFAALWSAERATRRWAWAGTGAASIALSAASLAVLRHLVRNESLREYLSAEAWKLAPQWPQFALFAVILVIALGWMTYLLLQYPWWGTAAAAGHASAGAPRGTAPGAERGAGASR